MDKLTRLESCALPIMNANVDTDIITPMNRLTTRLDKPLAHYAFEPLRYLGGNGDTGAPDPEFPLNDPKFEHATIMICGENFGCGSSRESAPAAIAALGIRCLIGSSFGDIFFNNCFQQGVLPVVQPRNVVERLATSALEGAKFEVDLASQRIALPGGESLAFDINSLKKQLLLEGLDDISLTLARNEDIAAFQARDRRRRPWVYDIQRH